MCRWSHLWGSGLGDRRGGDRGRRGGDRGRCRRRAGILHPRVYHLQRPYHTLGPVVGNIIRDLIKF